MSRVYYCVIVVWLSSFLMLFVVDPPVVAFALRLEVSGSDRVTL
jgi:hypothetical protein